MPREAHAVLAEMTARLGRSPSLVELMAEMATPQSGTPSVPAPAGPMPDGALSLLLGLQDIARMMNQPEGACHGPLQPAPTPWTGLTGPSHGRASGHPFPFPAPSGHPLGVRP